MILTQTNEEYLSDSASIEADFILSEYEEYKDIEDIKRLIESTLNHWKKVLNNDSDFNLFECNLFNNLKNINSML